MEPTEVFIVTTGEYSSYGISAVYLALEEATAAADEWGRVEVWPIGKNRRSLGTFTRSAQVDVRTHEVVEDSPGDYADLCDKPDARILWWGAGFGIHAGQIGIRVSAETEERANKVYGEVRARVLAELSEGLPPELIASYKWAPDSRESWVPTERVTGPR